nr:hypothetical protein [Sphingomonas bacterium]
MLIDRTAALTLHVAASVVRNVRFFSAVQLSRFGLGFDLGLARLSAGPTSATGARLPRKGITF